MNEKLESAIEVLVQQLEDQLREAADTKKMINSLRKRMGKDPMFEDVEVEQVQGGTIRPDAFYAKPLATAAQMFLERRKQASSADEILRGLLQGGFDFAALGWKEKERLRSLAMSLAKNTKTFHKLPNNTFGLITWYDKEMLKRAEKAQSEKADSVEPEKEDKAANA